METGTLHELLLRAREMRPNAVAVRDRQGAWTYTDLVRHSYGFALWLQSRCVGHGDRVLLQATSRRRTLAALYGCSMVGASVIPFSPVAGVREIEHALLDAQPRLALFESPIALSGHVITPADDVWHSITPADASDDEVRALCGPSDRTGSGPAVLIYTSGSTAAPKAVVCPSAQVLFAVSAIAERLRYTPDDVVYCQLPLSFDYGLYQAFLTAFCAAELVVDPGGLDVRCLDRIRRCGATVVPLVPALASILLRTSRGKPVDTSVRLFTNTGEALATEVVRSLRAGFPGAGVQLMYGTTECKRITILDVDGDRARPGSVGRPLTGTEVRILDDNGSPAAIGAVGEIVVSGPHVMDGYWNAPGRTERVFRPDGPAGRTILHTGDYGCLDPDGYLYIVGRRDSVFKRLGVRTSTDEIEAAVRAIPHVADTAVLRPEAGRDAVLFVVTPMPETSVLLELRRLLTPQKVPSLCRRVEQIPRQANGKVDRRALRALAEESG